MDYTTEKFLFKLKKAARYVQLYGPARTWIKIRGQHHMKQEFSSLPSFKKRGNDAQAHIGLIGCGNYTYSNLAYYISKMSGHKIRGVMDVNQHRAASVCEAYNASYYTDDASRIINDQNIDLIFIASNHSTHCEYAVECIKAGKNVHIEKPHVVSQAQLMSLTSTMVANPEIKVFLGFNRPRTALFHQLKQQFNNQPGPAMINWFIAGHEIQDDHWYFDKSEGGRVLGNVCHWTDLSLQLVGLEQAFPCSVNSNSLPNSKSDFVISISFADQSIASITFSAKGHTFEGVREVLNVHRGDLLANLTDFQSLTMEVREKKKRVRTWFRDHGHQLNIINSVENKSGEQLSYINATAKLFLAVRESVDTGNKIEVSHLEALGKNQR